MVRPLNGRDAQWWDHSMAGPLNGRAAQMWDHSMAGPLDGKTRLTLELGTPRSPGGGAGGSPLSWQVCRPGMHSVRNEGTQGARGTVSLEQGPPLAWNPELHTLWHQLLS